MGLLSPRRRALPAVLLTVAALRGSSAGEEYFFRLREAALPQHQALNLVNSTALPPPFASMATWGGSVVRDPLTGLFHIFAAGFVPGPARLGSSPCGLAAWESNSVVVTGSSRSPSGPFNAAQSPALSVAVGTFAHNPEVIYSAKERKYLLFVLGYRNGSTALPCDPSGSPIGRYPLGIPPWLSTVSLHTAASPAGPWSSGTVIAHGVNANPTPWVEPLTGEITLLYGRFDKPHRPHNRFYSVMTSPSSDGPWTPRGDLPPTLNPPSHCGGADPAVGGNPWSKCWCNNEDPFLFKLKGRWHLLFHQYTLPTAPNNKSELCHAATTPGAPPDPSLAAVGGHAMSTGEDIMGEWTYDYWRPAYGMNISWAANGSSSTGGGGPRVYRRERPKLLFDEHGEPEWLYNGVCIDGSSSGGGGGGGGGVSSGGAAREGEDLGGRNCFTLAQQIEGI